MSNFRFGQFVLDPAVGLADASGKLVPINQRGQAILETLLAAQGKAVSKSELMDRVWPGQIVEEGNLTVQIATLRKALGERPDGSEWIITVPRVGYRMVAAQVPTIPAATAKVAASLPEQPTLAVLPFQNLSGDPGQDYFADGIVEDIITALSRFKSFAVIARNSSFAYKGRAVDVRQVAKELGVRYILEGSVRKSGDTLRIAAQLVDGTDGSHLWAQNFDGSVDDVFAFQDQITASVAAIVEPKIQQAEIDRSRRERPDSLAAYDYYLRALQKLNTYRANDNAEAIALLEKTIALEPGFALALASAVYAYEHHVTMDWPPVSADDGARALALVQRALEVGRDDATVLVRCAFAIQAIGHDFDQGLLLANRAVEINPNNVLVLFVAGVIQIWCGSLDEAERLFQRVIELSPGATENAMGGLAHINLCRGRYQEALDWAGRSYAENPNFDVIHWLLIAANVHLGRMDEARRWLKTLLVLSPNITLNGLKAKHGQRDGSRMAAIFEGLRLAGLPEKIEKEVLPSLAVLPFSNLSSDPEQDYFADGIVEDIITALSRFKSFAVIARNSSFTYKGRAVDVRQVAKELGVRYILEGSVRKSDDTLRIAAQVVDGTTGNHLWAHKFDGSLSNVFDFQDRITAAVAIIVEPQIHAAELERSKRERPGSTEAYDLYLRALPKIFTKTTADYAETLALLDRALALEPNNAAVLSVKISILVSLDVMYAEPIGPDDRLRCLELVRRCLQYAAGDSTAMARCSAALIHVVKDYDWGMAVIGSALDVNPNNIFVVGTAGIANLHCGDLDEALSHFQRALTLSPRDPVVYWALTAIAHVHMIRGNYIEALSWAARSKALNPVDPCNLWILIAANAHLGRMAEAHHHLAELKRVAPGVTVKRIWAGQPQKYTDRCAAILDGLRLAGLE